MRGIITTVSIAIIIVLLVLFSSMFTVNQGSHALVLRFGKLHYSKSTNMPVIYGPGLHFKTPFITSVEYFDTRLQDLSVESRRVLTEEQKYVLVDYYAKWRIDDIPLYYKRTLDNSSLAQTLLSQKINDQLRAMFGERTISEVVSGERSDIMAKLKQNANDSAKSLGITVTDVRIQGIELPKEVQQSVFQRMSTQREQVATNLRAQGKASAEQIQATADATVTLDLAKAHADAQRIRAQGDQEAATIYNNAYGQDPIFYAFYKSLMSYQSAFNQKSSNTMVLDAHSPFFKYLFQLPVTTSK